jgi:CHAT domain-containing protein
MSKAEGLREVREVTLEVERLPRGKEARPFAHPYYWAAFVLVGDPNRGRHSGGGGGVAVSWREER